MDLLGPDENGKEGVIDIPEEYRYVKNYKASLTHKCNHSFTPNAKFSLFEHFRLEAFSVLLLVFQLKTF